MIYHKVYTSIANIHVRNSTSPAPQNPLCSPHYYLLPQDNHYSNFYGNYFLTSFFLQAMHS